MKIIVRNQSDLKRFIALIENWVIKIGKKYVAEFRQLQGKRTLDQNALFHLWCHVIEVETGQPEGDVKDFIKQRFMPSVTKQIFGFDVRTWRTRDLTIPQFGELLDLFKQWALDGPGKPSIMLLTLEDKNFMEFYETYK